MMRGKQKNHRADCRNEFGFNLKPSPDSLGFIVSRHSIAVFDSPPSPNIVYSALCPQIFDFTFPAFPIAKLLFFSRDRPVNC